MDMPEISYLDAMSRALREALNEDDSMFIMGEDVGLYGGTYAVTKGFAEEFGRQRIDNRGPDGASRYRESQCHPS